MENFLTWQWKGYKHRMFGSNFDLKSYLIRLFVLFLSISVHEWAHAYSAYRYGDDTAALQGRLTLNPLRHFEPVGLILILVGAPIAWARPVPINPNRFRSDVNRSQAMLWVSLSGITCNFLLAFTGSFLLYFMQFIYLQTGVAGSAFTVLQVVSEIALMMMLTNVFLGIFNLLPIPPLDGFELFSRILPRRLVWWLQTNTRMISSIMLMVIIFFRGGFSRFLNILANPVLYVLQWPWRTVFELLA